MNISFDLSNIFAISCLIGGIILFIKPKWFERVFSALLLIYGIMEVVKIS